MLIPRRSVRTSQPQHPTGLDRSNPLARGAYGWLATTPHVFYGQPNLSAVGESGYNTSPVGKSGIARKWDRTAAAGIDFGTQQIFAGQAVTVLVIAAPTSVSAMKSAFSQRVAGGSYQQVDFVFNGTNDGLSTLAGTVELLTYDGGSHGVTSLAQTDGNVHCWVASNSTTSGYILRDGVEQSLSQNAQITSAIYASNQKLAIGRLGDEVGSTTYQHDDPLYMVVVWDRQLSIAEAKLVSANPWQIFEDEEDYLFVPDASGGGSVSLIVADALHGHAVDSPSFSMATYLAVAESLHTHAADNVTLATTGTANLVVQEATHAHVADGVTLTTQWLLAVAEALHSHTADNITLGVTGTANLAIADATSGHTSDTVALTLNSLLAVFDAIHAHSADNLTLDTSNATALTVQDSTHAHGADNLGLSLDTWLAIVEAAHGHTADAPMLSLGQLSLQIADALHAMYSDIVFLTLPGGNLTTDQKFIIRATARRLAAIGLARNNIINRRAS